MKIKGFLMILLAVVFIYTACEEEEKDGPTVTYLDLLTTHNEDGSWTGKQMLKDGADVTAANNFTAYKMTLETIFYDTTNYGKITDSDNKTGQWKIEKEQTRLTFMVDGDTTSYKIMSLGASVLHLKINQIEGTDTFEIEKIFQ